MKRGNLLPWGAALCCLGPLLQDAPVLAGDFNCNLLMGALQVYNSNIFLASDQDTDDAKISDFVTTVTPAVEMVYETGKSKTALTVRQDIARYAEYDDLNRVDQSYDGKVDYALSELSSVSLNAAYKVDHSADSDLETSGLMLDTTKRERTNFGGEMQHAFSEKILGSLSYGYSREDYASGDYTDSEANNVSFTLSREVGWLPDAYVYGSGGALFYQTDYSRQNNISAVLGGGFRLTEGISLNFDAGVRKSRETYDEWTLEWLRSPPYIQLVAVERTEEQWGKVAHFRIAYEGESTNANLKFSYDVQPASGRGALTERTQVAFDIGRRLSEACRVRGFSSYFLNYRDSSSNRYNVDESTVDLGIDLTYDLDRYFSLGGQYRYTLNQDDEEGDEADRNQFLLRLSYKYPVAE